MSLWRLEWLRLVRTRRLVVLLGVFTSFGVLGPVSARYLGEIIERFGGGVTVEVPTPVPADGIEQFNLNAQQVGLLVVVLVAAAALTVDAMAEMSAFLRTRVARPSALLWPRVVVSFVATAVSYLVGVVVASYETWALLGPLPWGRVAIGAALGVAYLGFVVAVTALAATWTSSVLVAAGLAVAGLVALPIAGAVEPVGRWLPSHLVGALDALARGAAPGGYVRALVVTVVGTVAALAAAAAGLGRREV